MVSVDFSLILQLITVLVFTFLMSKVLFKPVFHILETREAKLSEDRQVAQRLQGEVAEKLADLELKLENTRKLLRDERHAAIVAATGHAESMLREAALKADVLYNKARTELEAEVERLKPELRLQAQSLAATIEERFKV